MDFSVLGPLQVSRDGRPIDVGAPKQQALLVYLLLHANEAIATDRLIDALWGETPPATVAKSVQVYVSGLRKALGEGILITRGRGYALQIDDEQLDARRFERLLQQGRLALEDGDPARAAETLRSALALWRGGGVAGLADEPFARDELARLEELRIEALEERIEADLALGRHADVIAETAALVRAHPLRERLRGHLILALYRSGRQAEALEAYQEARRTLTSELGLEPGPDLQRLQQAILDHDPGLAIPSRRSPLGVAQRRRVGGLAIAGGAAIVLTVVVIAALSDDPRPSVRIAGEGVGAVDPASGRLESVAPITGGPARLAATADALWVGTDVGHTLSALDPERATVGSVVSLHGYPSDIAANGSTLWMVDATNGRLSKISARYGEVAAATRLGTGRSGAFAFDREIPDPWSVAAGAGAVWVTTGSTRLVRVDAASAEVTARRDVGEPLSAVALGAGSVWVASGPGATVLRIDPRNTRVRARIRVVASAGPVSPYPIAIEFGLGSVWVLNANTATVTRIDPDNDGVVSTVPIGTERAPLRLAVGAGAVWVANADGTLARIDPSTNAVRIIEVANALVDVAVAGGRVWASARRGSGRTALPSSSRSRPAAVPLPLSACSPVAAAPDAAPRLLIASDLPLGGVNRALGAQMDNAIRYVLRKRNFKAGRYPVGYQVCDESTVEGGVGAPERCERNASAYARDRSVVGVIGTFSSSCALVEISITNRAGLAMLSPSNTYPGLTHGGPGAAPNEPGSHYPTGSRTYARIVADDSVQAASLGLLARQLGIRRLFVLQGRDLPTGLVDGVRYAARRLGVPVVGRDSWDSTAHSFTRLAERVRRARPDAVFLGGALIDNEGRLIRDLRNALPRARILAPDGFVSANPLAAAGGSAAEGMYVTIAGIPPAALGARGRKFAANLEKVLGAAPETYSIYAAQAAEVMLDAIARSDGTRASVVRELFRTRVRDGIIGDFALTETGDTTGRAITVYRIDNGRRKLFRILTPPRDLVPGS